MPSAVEEHVIYQIANAPLRLYPYPHLYVESIFPPDFYAALKRNWPQASQLVPIDSTGRVPKGAYSERFIMPLRHDELDKLPEDIRAFWAELAGWILESRYMFAVIDKFGVQLRERFGAEAANLRFSPEVLVVRDHTSYKLGPHTDSPRKLLSLLFYCPDDDRLKHLGTSLYLPLDPDFRCAGGPHHPHAGFKKVVTMDYRPNALFAFFKTDNSFHGVEPIRDADVLRDLMLYDIHVASQPAPQNTHRPASTSIGMRMLKRALRLGN